MPKKKEMSSKKVLDMRLRTKYNKSIKNEIGGQPNPFALTERENSSKKVLDKRFNLGYNEPIKNEVGNQPNPFALTEKKKMNSKKFLTSS